MNGITDFLDSILGGVDLITFSLAVGGVMWGLFILNPLIEHRNCAGPSLYQQLERISRYRLR